MKMRLKNRQTRLSTAPTPATADITENRITSITNASSLGIPSGYSQWKEQVEKREGERRREEKEREGEERGGARKPMGVNGRDREEERGREGERM